MALSFTNLSSAGHLIFRKSFAKLGLYVYINSFNNCVKVTQILNLFPAVLLEKVFIKLASGYCRLNIFAFYFIDALFHSATSALERFRGC